MRQVQRLTGVHDGLFVDDNIGRVGSGSGYSGCDGRAVSLQDDTIVSTESWLQIIKRKEEGGRRRKQDMDQSTSRTEGEDLNLPIIDSLISSQEDHIQPFQYAPLLNLSSQQQADGIVESVEGEGELDFVRGR
jgi:hypothetical protein